MLYIRIKELCEQGKISITELERKMQFGNGTIHKWDTVQPSLGKVKAVADYFDISIDELINSGISTKESRLIASEIAEMNDNQRNLVKCYISLIKANQLA